MRKTRRLWVTVLMALLFMAFSSFTASAEDSAIYALFDRDGDMVGFGYGLGYSEDGPVFLCPDLDSRILAVNITDETTICDLQKTASESGFFGFYELNDAEGDIIQYRCETPRANDTIEIDYVDQSEIMTITARVTKEYECRGSVAEIRLTCQDGARLRNSDIAPWIAYNANGRCVGAVLRRGDGYVLSTRWFDEEAFSGDSGNSGDGDASTPETPAVGSYSAPASVKLPEPDKGRNKDQKRNLIVAISAGSVLVLAAAAFFIIKTRNKGGRGHNDPPPSRLYLSCRGGYQDGLVFPLQNVVTIGRAGGNDIRYPDDYPNVSRKHATVALSYNGGRPTVMLKDTSSCGTYLKRGSIGENSASRIQRDVPVELHPGDVFYLAEHENRFELIEK